MNSGELTGATSHAASNNGAADVFAGGAITGRVVPSVDDFKAAWSELPQTRSMMLALPLFPLVVLGFALLTRITTQHEPDGALVPWSYVLGVVATLCGIAIGLYRFRARWAEAAVSGMRGAEVAEYHFDAEGFAIRAPGRNSQTAWHTAYGYVATRGAFAIYLTPMVCVIIPKRAFSPADQTRLSQALSTRLSDRPLRRKANRTLLVGWSAVVVMFLAIWLRALLTRP